MSSIAFELAHTDVDASLQVRRRRSPHGLRDFEPSPSDIDLSFDIALSGPRLGELQPLLGAQFVDDAEARRVMRRVAAATEAAHPDLAAALRKKYWTAAAQTPNLVSLTPSPAGMPRPHESAAVWNLTFDFIERLQAEPAPASAIAVFQDLIAEFGMRHFLVADLERPDRPGEDRVWATSWPPEWLADWASKKYQVDPIVRRLHATQQPVRWKRTPGGTADGDIPDALSDFYMNAGFAVPLFTRDGHAVGVVMAAEHYDLDRRQETCLHMAAIFFHAKLERLRARKNALPPKAPRLTRRERECLTWVAAGKTDWEISQILAIAEPTVHEYVQNALTKLKATTRAQAVAVAIYTGEIAI